MSINSDKKVVYIVKGIIVSGNQFLALHKSIVNEDWLDLPGGTVEYGETSEEAFKREVYEETGISIRNSVKVIDTWENIKPDKQASGIIYLTYTEEQNVILSSEHDKFEWLDINNNSIKNCIRLSKKE